MLNYLRQEVKITDRPERRSVAEEITDFPAVLERLREKKPDIVLSNYTASVPEGDYIVDNMPMTQPVGFRSGLEILKRWALLLERRREGEWSHDRALFEKYFA